MAALLLGGILLVLLVVCAVRVSLVLAKALLVFCALFVTVLLTPLVALLRSR